MISNAPSLWGDDLLLYLSVTNLSSYSPPFPPFFALPPGPHSTAEYSCCLGPLLCCLSAPGVNWWAGVKIPLASLQNLLHDPTTQVCFIPLILRGNSLCPLCQEYECRLAGTLCLHLPSARIRIVSSGTRVRSMPFHFQGDLQPRNCWPAPTGKHVVGGGQGL